MFKKILIGFSIFLASINFVNAADNFVAHDYDLSKCDQDKLMDVISDKRFKTLNTNIILLLNYAYLDAIESNDFELAQKYMASKETIKYNVINNLEQEHCEPIIWAILKDSELRTFMSYKNKTIEDKKAILTDAKQLAQYAMKNNPNFCEDNVAKKESLEIFSDKTFKQYYDKAITSYGLHVKKYVSNSKNEVSAQSIESLSKVSMYELEALKRMYEIGSMSCFMNNAVTLRQLEVVLLNNLSKKE